MYDRVPTLGNQEEGVEAYSPIKGVKESDILLIAGEDLLNSANNHGRKANDIKKVLNPVWLKSNLMKPNVMLAYVEEKTKKGQIFVELKFDRTKATFVKSSDQAKGGYLQVYVYLLESLATNIREYKTLRMSEFYGHAETIVNPKKSLTIAGQSDKRHKEYPKMIKYVKSQGEKYNPSQLEALKEVCEMKDDQMLLIQGPVRFKKTKIISLELVRLTPSQAYSPC